MAKSRNKTVNRKESSQENETKSKRKRSSETPSANKAENETVKGLFDNINVEEIIDEPIDPEEESDQSQYEHFNDQNESSTSENGSNEDDDLASSDDSPDDSSDADDEDEEGDDEEGDDLWASDDEEYEAVADYNEVTKNSKSNGQSSGSKKPAKLDGLAGSIELDQEKRETEELSKKLNETSIDPELIKGRSELDEKIDEYADGDSSDEELRNTIGAVPVEWYNDEEHIGYDNLGNKILKPDRGNAADELMRKLEDPNYANTVTDALTGQDVELAPEDLALLHRLVQSKAPAADYNMYEPFLDLYSHEVEEMPRSGRPEHKRSFKPSVDDRKKVSRFVHAIKNGLIHEHKRKKRYDMSGEVWSSDYGVEKMRRCIHPEHRAPPIPLPNNSRSYRPPPEFLPSKGRLEQVMAAAKTQKRRQIILNRIPQEHSSLRTIPNNSSYVMDVFNRLTDLYMASRFAYRRVVAKSKDLLPDLPKPRDLRPYPTHWRIEYKGHRSDINTLSFNHDGKFFATGSSDHTVRVWHVDSGRCVRTFDVGGVVTCVAWCPNKQVCILAVAVDRHLLLLNPESYLAEKSVVDATNRLLASEPDQGEYVPPEAVSEQVTWLQPSAEERTRGYRVVIRHREPVTQVVWHPQGDYLATLQPKAGHKAIVTHQLSRHRSQIPFGKASKNVTRIAFHPRKQLFYICTHDHIRIYSLTEKKLKVNVRLHSSEHISCMAVHPSGEHFVVGTYNRKLTWIEMEYTDRPLTLRNLHAGAVRSVSIHPKYPLMASASDNGNVCVTYAKVYRDYLKDPMIVPVQDLWEHQVMDHQCVLDSQWHPTQPFLFTAGKDGTVRCWQ